MSLHSGATDTVIKSFAGDPNGNVNIEASEASTAELLYDSVGGTLYAGDAADNGTNNNWTAVISGAGPTPLYTLPGTPDVWYTATEVLRQNTLFVTQLTDQSGNTNNATFPASEVVLGITGANDSKGLVPSISPFFPSAANFTPTSASTDHTIIFTGSFDVASGNGNYVTLLTEVGVSGGTNVLQINAGVSGSNITIDFDADPTGLGGAVVSNSTATDDDLHIYMVRRTGANVEFYQDGVAIGTAVAANSGSFGVDSTYYDYSACSCVCDLIVYSSALSTADLNTAGTNMQAFHGTPAWTTIV